MSKWFLSRGLCAAVVVLTLFAMIPPPVGAMHPWASHWGRTTSGIRNIPVRRRLSAIWLARYNTAMTDWRKPAMTRIRPYTLSTTAQSSSCPFVLDEIQVCDGNYGNTGWGGYAQVSWDGTGHTRYARALQNNYYYVGSSATVVADRQLVICQEIGHLLGLGHVNEIMNNPNVGSCMDYTNDADGGPGGASNSDPNNMHPYAHDYALINSRHNHIGMIVPEVASRQTEAPRAMQAMLASSPTSLAQLGSLTWSGNGGLTERYEMEFAGGWGMATWVIKVPKGL